MCRARLAASPSVLTFQPSLGHPALSGPVSWPGTTRRGSPRPEPAALTPAAGQHGGPGSGAGDARGREGARRLGRAPPRGRSQRPRLSRAPAPGSRAWVPPHLPPVSGMRPNPAPRPKPRLPLHYHLPRSAAAAGLTRGSRLLRPDRGTRGGGWMGHSPSPPATAAPGPRLLPARAPPRALPASR